MRSLWMFTGKNKCAGSTAYTLGETAAEATARLVRRDSCEFFEWISCERVDAGDWKPANGVE